MSAVTGNAPDLLLRVHGAPVNLYLI